MHNIRRRLFGLGSLVVAVCAMAILVAAAPKENRAKDPTAPVVRASAITGMHVKNANDEKLGKVEDVVIDMHTGKIRYAAVSFGGFLGLGDKLFAVPFQALKVQHNTGDKSTYFILNVDQDKLKNAPGFDKDNWPDFGDPSFGTNNDKHYIDQASVKPSAK